MLIILSVTFPLNAIIANIEANVQQETSSTSVLPSGDDMDIDDNNMANSFSHGMMRFIDIVTVEENRLLIVFGNKIDTGSSYQQIPLSAKDNVFAAEEDEVENEHNDDNVINAEDIEFGDDDGSNNANGTTNVDEGSWKK